MRIFYLFDIRGVLIERGLIARGPIKAFLICRFTMIYRDSLSFELIHVDFRRFIMTQDDFRSLTMIHDSNTASW